MDELREILDLLNENGPAVTAVATVVLACLTYVLASENRKLRQAGSEPEVVAYLTPHRDGNGGVNFVLANIGKGPAKDVRFEFIHDVDDFKLHEALLYNDNGRAALTVLPQGEKIRSLFGIGYVLFGAGDGGGKQALKPFKVRITYLDLTGRSRQSEHKIDISQFSGLRGLQAKPADRSMADALNKMESHLGKIAKQAGGATPWIDSTKIDDPVRQKMKGEAPTSTTDDT